MKFQNNNQEVIKRLTKRELKSNKIRNLFGIAAIILTTFMISTLFSIGISFKENYEVMQRRMQGTTATTSLNNPSKDQIEEIEDLDIFNALGSEINIGKVVSDKLNKDKMNINVQYDSDEYWEKMIVPCVSDIEGQYPKKSNEIMMSRKALDLLDIKNIKIGDKINLSYKIKDQIKNEDFILSGKYTNYSYSGDNGYILTSKAFADKNNLTLSNNGTLYMQVDNKYKDTCDDILKENINLDDTQEFSYYYDVEKNSSQEIVALAVILVSIVLFLMISAYLFIYNVMYISVNKDINFYGLLKTIGTSPKQINKIVRGQFLRLSIIGIPIGLILSGIVSFKIVPLVLGNFVVGTETGAMPNIVSFNPVIFIGAMLFTLLTVLISVRKPAKIASNISPTEALKYIATDKKSSRKSRKSTNGGKLYKMAWYNVFRDKKRAIVVFLSLFMGIITFLSVNTFIKSIGIENYIDRYYQYDFKMQDRRLGKKLTDNDVTNIKNMTGVKNISIMKTADMEIDLNNPILDKALNICFASNGLSGEELSQQVNEIKQDYNTAYIMGLDDNIISEYNKSADEPINIDEFKKGKIAIYQNSGERYSKELSKCLDMLNGVSMNLKSNDGKVSNDFLMKEVKKDPYENLRGGDIPNMGWVPIIYISNSMLEKLNDNNVCNYMIYINCDSKYEKALNNKLEVLCSNKGLDFRAKAQGINNFKNLTFTVNVLGGGISIILLLIGLLNFINVMITGVNSRLKEFAVLESIGMTKKQLKKMLTLEGAYYATITVGFIATLGMMIIYGISKLTKVAVDYADFVFPSIPLTILIIGIVIICLATPRIVYKVTCKETITERLRKIEN